MVGGPAPVVGVAPAPAPADSGALSFLAQLKTALAGLASVAMPQQAPVTGTVATVAAAEPDVAAPAEDAKDDPSTDVMPEMLAALGFLPVPTALQPPIEPQTSEGSTGTAAPGPAVIPTAMAPLATAPQAPSSEPQPAPT